MGVKFSEAPSHPNKRCEKYQDILHPSASICIHLAWRSCKFVRPRLARILSEVLPYMMRGIESACLGLTSGTDIGVRWLRSGSDQHDLDGYGWIWMDMDGYGWIWVNVYGILEPQVCVIFSLQYPAMRSFILFVGSSVSLRSKHNRSSGQ